MEFMAQRCFPLQDTQVIRTPEERIIIRAGSESFTYDTKKEDSGDKSAFVATFRKTKDDLRKSQEADVQEKDRTQDSYSHLLSRDPAFMNRTELLDNLSDGINNEQVSTFIDMDGQQRNIRWVESQLDDLDIEIALQHFQEAVLKVDRLKALAKNIKSNEMAKTIVTYKVNERAAKLANVLVKHMVEHNNWFTSVRQHVSWVVQLGFEDRAREAYLEARGNLIKTRTRYVLTFVIDVHRPLTLSGNVYSKVTFPTTSSKLPTSISPSSKTLSTCFKNASHNSSCPLASNGRKSILTNSTYY
jgi:hypothetical protein